MSTTTTRRAALTALAVAPALAIRRRSRRRGYL
jgi:hypothetical protein